MARSDVTTDTLDVAKSHLGPKISQEGKYSLKFLNSKLSCYSYRILLYFLHNGLVRLHKKTRQRERKMRVHQSEWYSHVWYHSRSEQIPINNCLTSFTCILFLFLEYICFFCQPILCSPWLYLVSTTTNLDIYIFKWSSMTSWGKDILENRIYDSLVPKQKVVDVGKKKNWEPIG